jgi:hypothetical protein
MNNTQRTELAKLIDAKLKGEVSQAKQNLNQRAAKEKQDVLDSFKAKHKKAFASLDKSNQLLAEIQPELAKSGIKIANFNYDRGTKLEFDWNSTNEVKTIIEHSADNIIKVIENIKRDALEKVWSSEDYDEIKTETDKAINDIHNLVRSAPLK